MKKSQNSALYSTQWPPDNYPDALGCLAIVLDANKCTKLGKLTEKLLLKPPLPSTVVSQSQMRKFEEIQKRIHVEFDTIMNYYQSSISRST